MPENNIPSKKSSQIKMKYIVGFLIFSVICLLIIFGVLGSLAIQGRMFGRDSLKVVDVINNVDRSETPVIEEEYNEFDLSYVKKGLQDSVIATKFNGTNKTTLLTAKNITDYKLNIADCDILYISDYRLYCLKNDETKLLSGENKLVKNFKVDENSNIVFMTGKLSGSTFKAESLYTYSTSLGKDVEIATVDSKYAAKFSPALLEDSLNSKNGFFLSEFALPYGLTEDGKGVVYKTDNFFFYSFAEGKSSKILADLDVQNRDFYYPADIQASTNFVLIESRCWEGGSTTIAKLVNNNNNSVSAELLDWSSFKSIGNKNVDAKNLWAAYEFFFQEDSKVIVTETYSYTPGIDMEPIDYLELDLNAKTAKEIASVPNYHSSTDVDPGSANVKGALRAFDAQYLNGELYLMYNIFGQNKKPIVPSGLLKLYRETSKFKSDQNVKVGTEIYNKISDSSYPEFGMFSNSPAGFIKIANNGTVKKNDFREALVVFSSDSEDVIVLESLNYDQSGTFHLDEIGELVPAKLVKAIR